MIDINNLTVRYGRLTAVRDLSIHLPRGELFGFIGPNGAGKTTTMKVLSCLLAPTRGSAAVDGLDVRKDADAVRRVVGFMPDFLGVYNDLTVSEYLQFFAAAFRVPRAKRPPLIDEVLELTDLTAKKHALVDSLSRGMQQRLGVARVLVHDPKVLLLDEPASGLDPRARIELRELLRELGKMGKTIVVSSHILSELHDFCTSIGIVEKGRRVFSGAIEDAFRAAGGEERITVRVEGDPETARAALAADSRVLAARVEDGAVVVDLEDGSHGHHFLIERLLAAGARIDSFSPRARKLEEVFLKLTKGHVQ